MYDGDCRLFIYNVPKLYVDIQFVYEEGSTVLTVRPGNLACSFPKNL